MQTQLALNFDVIPMLAVLYRSDAERKYWEPLFRAEEAVMQRRNAWAEQNKNQPKFKGKP